MEATDVVVGVDGSDRSVTALRWAAAETHRGGGRLRIVLAERETGEAAAVRVRGMLERAGEQASAVAPGIVVEAAAVAADPASALLDAAADARIVVVGRRGGGGFASLLLGSVSLRVATHAPCPVAVVRTDTNPSGSVVVGVNGSEVTTRLLELAFEQAARRGCALVAARAYPGRPAARPGADLPAEADLRAELVRLLAPWRDKYPRVPVEYTVVPGRAGDVLVALSGDAQLVAVGARGLGGFAGLLLGSTSQYLIHHAGCPVLICRIGRAR